MALIYLKYIKPWLMRLTTMDKAIPKFPLLGQIARRKNYKVLPKWHIFTFELNKIQKAIKQTQKNKANLNKYSNYEALLLRRQKNINLNLVLKKNVNIEPNKKNIRLNNLNTNYLNKQTLILFFLIIFQN
jgi:hypothetical protein